MADRLTVLRSIDFYRRLSAILTLLGIGGFLLFQV